MVCLVLCEDAQQALTLTLTPTLTLTLTRTPQQAMPLLDLVSAFPVVMKNYLRGGDTSPSYHPCSGSSPS